MIEPLGEAEWTLEETRRWLWTRLADGEHCPCCGQYAKIYPRQITSSMAHKLILLFKMHGFEWFHLPTSLAKLGIPARDEAFLKFWKLIEEATEKREDGGRAGWWRVTGPGKLFISNILTVPRYAMVYDNHLLHYQGDNISIKDALKKKFDYEELMEGI
jgi:hypothetical protein